MKLAHIAIVTPGKCGLYETVRETIAAERALGADARIYDPAPTKFYPTGQAADRGAALFQDKAFLSEADVIVDHSGCDGTTDQLDKPHILVAHGRPRHSFNSEVNGGAPIYSYHYRLNKTPKYKAVVTFWPEHVGHLRVMFPDKPVYAVNPPTDLKHWTPTGPNGYNFHGKAGAFNVVCADSWRDDVDPFNAVCAFALAAREVPGMRLHIYGKQGGEKGWPVLLKRLADDGTLGEVCGWVSGLENVYRAADLGITPHTIYTRSIREPLACGCPVVSGRDCDTSDVQAFAKAIVEKLRNPDRKAARDEAERKFDAMNTARGLLAIAEGVVRGG